MGYSGISGGITTFGWTHLAPPSFLNYSLMHVIFVFRLLKHILKSLYITSSVSCHHLRITPHQGYPHLRLQPLERQIYIYTTRTSVHIYIYITSSQGGICICKYLMYIIYIYMILYNIKYIIQNIHIYIYNIIK